MISQMDKQNIKLEAAGSENHVESSKLDLIADRKEFLVKASFSIMLLYTILVTISCHC